MSYLRCPPLLPTNVCYRIGCSEAEDIPWPKEFPDLTGKVSAANTSNKRNRQRRGDGSDDDDGITGVLKDLVELQKAKLSATPTAVAASDAAPAWFVQMQAEKKKRKKAAKKKRKKEKKKAKEREKRAHADTPAAAAQSAGSV